MNRAVQREKRRIFKERARRIPRLCRLPVVVVIALFASMEPVCGDDVVRNSRHGFSFRAPAGWQAAPFPTLDPFTLYRYKAPYVEYASDNPYASFTPGLTVSCWHPDRNPPAGALIHDRLFPSFSCEQYLKAMLPAAVHREIRCEPDDGDTGMSRQAFATLEPTARGPALTIRHDVAHFAHGDGIITFRFSCLEERFEEQYDRLYQRTWQSFVSGKIPMRGRTETAFAMNYNDRYIEEQIERLPDHWRFTWTADKEYILFSDIDEEGTQRVAGRLARWRRLFSDHFPGPARIEWIPIVRLCSTREEYRLLSRRSGSSGHWCDAGREMALFRSPSQEDTEWMKVVGHEAFHQFIHFLTGCAPAPWFDEGFAEYFSAAAWRDHGWKMGKNAVQTSRIRRAIEAKKQVPLKEFMYLTNREFLEIASLRYAQAWSVVYFLRHGTAGHGEPGKRWARIPDDFMNNLLSTLRRMEMEDPAPFSAAPALPPEINDEANRIALQATFEGWTDREWQRLEEAWIDFSR